MNKSDQFSVIEIPHATNDVGCYDLKGKYESLSLHDLEFIDSHKTMQNSVLQCVSTRDCTAW